MARIRTIKPSFWSDAAVADLSRDARLLLLGLISFADDEGRFVASTSAIGGYVYPHDELPPATIKRWLTEIGKRAPDIISFYTVDARHYGCFRNYAKHQVINRPQSSTLPPPPHDGHPEDSWNDQ